MSKLSLTSHVIVAGFSLFCSQPPADVQKAEEVVAAHLEKIKGGNGKILQISDESLTKTFPKYSFFAVRYRMYPVAEQRPEGMAASNVFAVKDGKLEHVKDTKALEEFFKQNAEDIKNEAYANVGRSWLWLSQEFVQDGFYKFEILNEFIVETAQSQFDLMSGRAVVVQGGNGEIKIQMIFVKGKITEVTETTKVIPGPRPICQATKLLDPDPIVRKMAEQDLLYLGLAARDYMMEQRDKAAPELRDAIDRLWNKILQNGW